MQQGGHNLVSISLISGRIRERLADARKTRDEAKDTGAAVAVGLGVEQGG